MKTCEHCPAEAIHGERFCKECKKRILAMLKDSGYLTPRPFTPYRPVEKREVTHETKHGVDR